MSGHHTSGGSSNWKLGILVGVLVVVIVALAFLCIRFVLGDPAPSAPETTLNISAQVAAQDAAGKDVTKNLAITEGTMTPETDDPNAQFVLLDISWAGKKDPVFPMIVTISDPGFPDDDGLAVYHYADGQWSLLGTYLIKNNSVSFQTDALSPFAFQVISANPQPTATPEPTAEPTATPEPTPEVTPAPTPEPIDYGKYGEEQDGTYIQADKLKVDREYVIALIDTENEVDLPQTDGITFFGDDDDKVYNAQILLHYDEDELTIVEAQVAQTKDGKFYLLDTVVEGMLWTTEKEEYAYGADRLSLVNNGKYLNLDNPNENVVIDEDSGRTRWLYEEIDIDGEDVYTLTYRANLDRFFVKEMKLVDAESEDETSESEETENAESDAAEVLRMTATATRNEALVLHIFALDSDVETDLVSGTLVTSGTPTPTATAGTTATATPKPTSSSTGGGSSATPTAVPTAKPTPTAKPSSVPTAVPTTKPTAEPTAVPTTVPTTVPETTTKPTDTNTNRATPVPEATKKPTGTNTD